MEAIFSGTPFTEKHSMEAAFRKFGRFAKLVVTEPSDWKQVKPLFRTLHDGTIREYTRDGDQEFWEDGHLGSRTYWLKLFKFKVWQIMNYQ